MRIMENVHFLKAKIKDHHAPGPHVQSHRQRSKISWDVSRARKILSQ